MNPPPAFPRLELPDDALVLFESTRPEDPDRSASWRFTLDRSGCYRVARNTAGPFVDASRLGEDDPALFWNNPLPKEPTVCLDAPTLARIQGILEHLPTASALPDPGDTDDAATARWTVRTATGTRSVLIPAPDRWRHATARERLAPWWSDQQRFGALHDLIRESVAAAKR